MADAASITEVLPKVGLVYSEKGTLNEVLCKPKIMPLKSITLTRLQEMEKLAARQGQPDDEDEGAVAAGAGGR